MRYTFILLHANDIELHRGSKIFLEPQEEIPMLLHKSTVMWPGIPWPTIHSPSTESEGLSAAMFKELFSKSRISRLPEVDPQKLPSAHFPDHENMLSQFSDWFLLSSQGPLQIVLRG